MKTLKKLENNSVNLPLKLSFSDEGFKLLMKNQIKVKPIRMANNDLVYGIHFKNISYEYLRKLIRAQFILAIEIGQSEFTSKKDQIIDLTKFIYYEFTYQLFSKKIFNELIGTSFVKNWNRNNPGKIIDGKTKINKTFLNLTVFIKEEEIKNLKKSIINGISNHYLQNINLTDQERQIKVEFAIGLIDFIQKFSWYIILQSKNNVDFTGIIERVKQIIIDYIEKLKIADYLGLVIIEIIRNAENVKLLKVLKKMYRQKKLDALISNKEIRDSVFEQFAEKKDYIYFNYKFKTQDNTLGFDRVLQMTLLNQAYEYNIIKQDIESKIMSKFKDTNIFKYYNDISSEIFDNQSGLYYLTYLRDICKEKNISFKSYVSQVAEHDQPLITLSLNFK